LNATQLTWCLRHARDGQRWSSGDELGDPAQVLRDRCKCELELGTARSAQSQAAKSQNAFEMCKQHLNTFSITA
jgi:hypothetical protein